MLIFRDFFTNGMDCLLVFCLSPGPWVSLAAPPRCLLSSVPITLSPHRVPVILPTLWRVFLHPRPSFLLLFPHWWLRPARAELLRQCAGAPRGASTADIVALGGGLAGHSAVLFWACILSSVPPSTARMSGRIWPLGEHLATVCDLTSFPLTVITGA